MIENKISPLVESQFPSFYKKEGKQFIAFVKAYYAWLEQSGNAIHEARKIPEYTDIDTTIDDFIIHFKEKYLKNIQFDTATNKKLLVKHATDLYSSKGTEQSIDLFFKLIYGAEADIIFPSEQIFSTSSASWEKPEYIEISLDTNNSSYVGKQIIGSISGATAFVERYVSRKLERGYSNILYISNINKSFIKDEVLGVITNNKPVYNINNAIIIGSTSTIELFDRAREYNIGDIVNFTSSNRGNGGVARVSETQDATGVVDFNLEDGGFGYSLDSETIISEKVITYSSAITTENDLFDIKERVYQPILDISYQGNTSPNIGDKLYGYISNIKVAEADIIGVTKSGNTFNIIISPLQGNYTANTIYHINSNTFIFTSNTIIDKTISALSLGTPNTVNISIIPSSDVFTIGDQIKQIDSMNRVASANIRDFDGTTIKVTNLKGTFKNSNNILNDSYTVETGNIAFTTTTKTVTGNSTIFDNSLINKIIYNSSNSTIGQIQSVSNTTSLLLYDLPNISGNGNFSTTVSANLIKNNITTTMTKVDSINGNFGTYDISEYINRLNYSGANTQINLSSKIYQYNANNITAEGLILTSTIPVSNSGHITYIPISGFFDDTEKVYLSSNTGTFIINEKIILESGGDFISSNSYIYAPRSNTTIYNPVTSFGSGADYKIGSINNPYDIIVNTDYIIDESQKFLDTKRKILSITSNTGFSINDTIIQKLDNIKFNPSSINANTGFIPINNASARFPVSSIIKYNLDSGNTLITELIDNSYYYVYSSNSTGLILSNPYNLEQPLNNINYPDFANNIISETGHSFHKEVGGLIRNITSNDLYIKNNPKLFGVSGGVSNTTSSSNSSIYLLDNPTVNTAITTISDDISVLVSEKPYAYTQINSNAYGFPKNKQGNLSTLIFNLLEFFSGTVGTIFSLGSINPGTDYNIDPYTIVFNPNTVGYNLRDYKIEIENPTGIFKEGELVFQDSIVSNIYDITVSNGVFSNTTIEQTNIFNSGIDVDSTTDTIYYPIITKTFNSNTSVVSNTIIINQEFLPNDIVKYYTDTGNTVLTGLSNNTLYYVTNPNSTSIGLSSTANGAILSITSSLTENGHNIRLYRNSFINNIPVKYDTISSNAVTGLANGSIYYIKNSNTIGFSLSDTANGSTIDITGLSTGTNQTLDTVLGYKQGDLVYQEILKIFNANTSVITANNFISLTPNPYSIGNKVNYFTDTGNTVILGLSNNNFYFIKTSNSTGITLSSTLGGNTTNITKGLTETGHNLLAISNSSIKSVYNSGTSHVVVQNTDNGIANSYILKSYTNPLLDANTISFDLLSSSKERNAIVKSSNSSILKLKRISLESNFTENELIYGEQTGSSALIKTIEEDDETEIIGLNAIVSANVVTVDGQVKSLQVIDSGFGYSNNELIIFNNVTQDSLGTGKIITDSVGKSQGYYKKRKGFPSSDSHIHDGDYYQEYSYEVQTKISLGKFSEIFKKVMHTAGTKFFASTLITSNEKSPITYLNSEYTPEIFFNANTDIQTNNILIEDNPFIVDDKVQYYTDTGNTIVSGLANNDLYFIKTSNTSSISLSNTLQGNTINIISGLTETGHHIAKVNL